MTTLAPFIRTPLFLVVGLAAQAQAASDSKDINDYLVDISAGSVSAAGIVGAKSGITTIESSQDLVVALQPFGASGGQKSAFGIAITPAKTTLTPMAGSTYVGSSLARLLGNLTLSYAQNQLDYGGKAYKAQGYSINTLHYFNEKDDPVYAGSLAFKDCADRNQKNREAKEALIKQRVNLTKDAFEAELQRLTDEAEGPLFKCIDQSLKALSEARWNSARMSVSYGQGRLGASDGGSSYSLGRSMNLNAQLPAGAKGAIAISLRRATGALDTDTLTNADQTYKSSSLAAARYTYGDQETTALRALVEISNAKSTSGAAFQGSFKYAIGIDKKLSKGSWLEFRLGRNRATTDGKEQTAALLDFNIAPSLFEFKK